MSLPPDDGFGASVSHVSDEEGEAMPLSQDFEGETMELYKQDDTVHRIPADTPYVCVHCKVLTFIATLVAKLKCRNRDCAEPRPEHVWYCPQCQVLNHTDIGKRRGAGHQRTEGAGKETDQKRACDVRT